MSYDGANVNFHSFYSNINLDGSFAVPPESFDEDINNLGLTVDMSLLSDPAYNAYLSSEFTIDPAFTFLPSPPPSDNLSEHLGVVGFYSQSTPDSTSWVDNTPLSPSLSFFPSGMTSSGSSIVSPSESEQTTADFSIPFNFVPPFDAAIDCGQGLPHSIAPSKRGTKPKSRRPRKYKCDKEGCHRGSTPISLSCHAALMMFLAFDRLSNLKSHITTHDPHADKPYICHFAACGKAFKRRHDLKRHLGTQKHKGDDFRYFLDSLTA
ncbi:hypothetical protein AX16_002895 [Volvariella volvacea WC 439]|nr:hypothetical protein AX16_002895 [Volvariella volvacea WC 439]